jgi:hypothetical protein
MRRTNPVFYSIANKDPSMSLSSAALAAIQQAGAAAFTADVELKNAVKDYAERVNAALLSNPYGLGNDALFENWKVVARLAQTMDGIEDELRQVYQVAAELTADDRPTVTDVPALAAPKRRAAKSKAKVRAKASRAKPALTSVATSAPSGNPAKLLQHLERILNSDEFTVIHQSAISLEIGIPLGSMTAATKKLIESGRLIAGPSGSYKLANQTAAQA